MERLSKKARGVNRIPPYRTMSSVPGSVLRSQTSLPTTRTEKPEGADIFPVALPSNSPMKKMIHPKMNRKMLF